MLKTCPKMKKWEEVRRSEKWESARRKNVQRNSEHLRKEDLQKGNITLLDYRTQIAAQFRENMILWQNQSSSRWFKVTIIAGYNVIKVIMTCGMHLLWWSDTSHDGKAITFCACKWIITALLEKKVGHRQAFTHGWSSNLHIMDWRQAESRIITFSRIWPLRSYRDENMQKWRPKNEILNRFE